MIDYTVRDLFDRPWARIWEEYFEKGNAAAERSRRPGRIQVKLGRFFR